MTETKRIAIFGVGGLLGRAATEHFGSRGWDVIGVARRRPELAAPLRFVGLDLTDAEACRASSPAFAGVTHVLYAALYEKPDLIAGWRDAEQIATNLAMMKNAMAAAETPALRHVTLLQGTKAYGSHIEPTPVPAKERWPRHPHENFYWEQQDWLAARQRGRDWGWTILRPQAVLGHAIGSPMNVMAALGAYAAILRELGRPLAWPGGGRYVCALSDSALFAEAVEWAGAEPRAGGEAYNIVNGDVIVWQDLWPAVAAHFGMETGSDRPMRLAEEMPQHADTWQRIVAKHRLRPLALDALIGSSWQFADRAFAAGIAAPPDTVLSTIKARKHGFAACIDSEDSVTGWLARMQREGVLPA